MPGMDGTGPLGRRPGFGSRRGRCATPANYRKLSAKEDVEDQSTDKMNTDFGKSRFGFARRNGSGGQGKGNGHGKGRLNK
jgi:hypothetical protein